MIPAENAPAETWRPAVGLEKWYEVSNLGRARRVRSAVGRLLTIPKVLRPTLSQQGYPAVRVFAGKEKWVGKTIHSMVAEAFLGPRPEGYEVDHVNGNRKDARLSNLEYVTRQENLQRAARMRRARRSPEDPRAYERFLTGNKYAGRGTGLSDVLAARMNRAPMNRQPSPSALLAGRYGGGA